MGKWHKGVSGLALAALLSACGGGGTGGGATAVTPTPPPTSSSTCALRARQDFVLAAMNENYLFPETLPANTDPTPYATVSDYLDFLTATARAQGRDRFFTYLTSIAEENAFNSSGASAGFGIRIQTDATARRVFVAEAFEGAPALAAGIDRGTEIVGVGTTIGNVRTVSDIIASEGTPGITNAFGPTTAGTTRVLRVTDAAGTRDLTVTKADFSLSPVSTRYGAKIIDDNGTKVGYLNLRTFISSADSQLRTAFDQFRAAGVTRFIVDFRYNGGGLVSTAELMGDLMGGNRARSEVFSITSFRPEKSANNSTKRFAPVSQSVSPVKLAFIGTGSTASASELVINAFIPYFGSNLALVGANTFGKPVGQIAVDRPACDDRLRVIAFSLRNSANSDAYYSGLAGAVSASCAASDDVTKPLGDPLEASTKAALDFLAGRSCGARIAGGGQVGQAFDGTAASPALLSARNPTVPQREVPGLF